MNPAEVQQRATRVAEHGAALWDAGFKRRAAWLAAGFARLTQQSGEGGALTRSLSASSGLSEPMTAWALDTTLRTFDVAALERLVTGLARPGSRAEPAHHGRLCAVLLSGNVCTAPARALAIPLMLGWPTLAKASSRDGVLAFALQEALVAEDPELATALDVLPLASEDAPGVDALLAQADAVSVYGGDATLASVRARVATTTSFVGHGHGLGVGLVLREALDDDALTQQVLEGFALDVAAYDQRGCLSPHAILVEAGGKLSPEAFAEKLHQQGLAELARRLPRGDVPLGAGSAQLVWRGVAAANGTLHEGDTFAVSHEGQAEIRISPGYRNVQVLTLRDRKHLGLRLRQLGVHLKCVGVGGVRNSLDDPEREDLRALARALPPRVAPRLCAAGEMQTPPADALCDGLSHAEGLVRWVDL